MSKSNRTYSIEVSIPAFSTGVQIIEYRIIQAGRGREVSVGLVRRETPRRLKDQRRTDIRDISKAVVGRAVNLLIKLGVGRRARQRHTEVRSSYHFRVGTKVNSTTYAVGIHLSAVIPGAAR
ncbi:hypothetical protein PPACK8108_LOCUS12280 [Phakopsora pachyrhizi]|uniref:Uncharacterized protein n=1 Tax=Phakopsora pachyrhizi TaxID=170000 RepID=A0AAV0B3R5_PHAPC|nr:hypothetical protein PPACK8108_LOCUS12280 [Phakopsora pachyrhizi]